MTAGLTDRQTEALDAYFRLMESCPGLFEGREMRPIVRDRPTVERFAAEHGTVLGVVTPGPYMWLVNDLVRSRTQSGEPFLHPYIRIVEPSAPGQEPQPGAVVLATLDDPDAGAGERIVLIRQERHATGVLELELPRGHTRPGVAAADQALTELREETGYLGESARLLGTMRHDTALTAAQVSYFHVRVTSQGPAEHEITEAIAGIVLLTRQELWERIDSGEMRDSFTVHALALYERALSRGVPEIRSGNRL